MYSQDDSLPLKPKWYFTREEIEEHSSSRKDGIDCNYESHLRQSYCTYIQKLGEVLKVPQMTIATALMLCHRFYMHQSHAKNHWQTIANASMFLACKAEETPRWLKDLIVVAYKLMYSWDPLAPKKIREKEVYDKQKQLILLGEQLILVTVAFDLNIEHPYKPLTAALKRFGTPPKQVVQVAWNYVNDSLRTTLCLQYKPHYIAAGSIFLAAKSQKMKLPSANGKKWWMQFDVSPKQLEEVIQQMIRLLEPSNVHAMAAPSKTTNVSKPLDENRESGISESHNLSRSTSDQDSINHSSETCRILSKPAIVKCSQKQASYDAHETAHTKENCTSDTGSANSVVEDGDAEIVTGDSNHNTSCKIVSVKEKIDISRIREKLKRRKLEKRKSGDEILSDDDAWIEREIEKGVDSLSALP